MGSDCCREEVTRVFESRGHPCINKWAQSTLRASPLIGGARTTRSQTAGSRPPRQCHRADGAGGTGRGVKRRLAIRRR
eukprot:scaffold22439_cov63-Phaeocystis_antarctica.AAC.2